jgi:Transcriptional regulators
MLEEFEKLVKNKKLSIKQISELTGLSRSTVKRYCDKIGYVPIRHEVWNKNKKMSFYPRGKRGKLKEETKIKISQTMKANGISGGYREGSGRGRKTIYNNILYRSKFLLEIVRILEDESIKYQNVDKIFYFTNKKRTSMKLDFYLPEYDCYLVVKEFPTNLIISNIKQVEKQNNIKVILIDDFIGRRLRYEKLNNILINVFKKI